MSAPGCWTAIVLAGQRQGENVFARNHGVQLKALIPVGGRPMVARVIEALRAAPSVGDIIILAQEPDRLATVLPGDSRIRMARSQGGIAQSIRAVAGKDAPFPVLVVTADHALLTAEMIETFLRGSGGDVSAALVDRKVVEAAYPETRRTWLRFSDGDYSGANLFALTGEKAYAALDLWSGVEKDRKKALKLLTSFGPVLAVRALTRTISLDKALAALGKKVGVEARAVRLPFAEAAIDVDKEEDLELVEAILKRR
ncbi:nucleotidyltransferase family protein [Allosphingosinicella flava]|uniref:Nucleotidyltransferase family protein n=1 Tax=Allosphingosinicella flava TaxID=2771430 RepID=A0A7T2GM00_9SPHN|nr:nucleotidyltransferase family protein [Sphingosinicella flava]QPQ56340.1 nucleotidyltransferase family protein [Sphingosinicella flava]